MSIKSSKTLTNLVPIFGWAGIIVLILAFISSFYYFSPASAKIEWLRSGTTAIFLWLIAVILFLVAFAIHQEVQSRNIIEDQERDFNALKIIENHHQTALRTLRIADAELKIASMRDEILAGPTGEQAFITDYAVHYSLCLGSKTLFEKFDWLVKVMGYIHEPNNNQGASDDRKNLSLKALEKSVVIIGSEWSRAILFFILEGESDELPKWAPFAYEWLENKSDQDNFTPWIVSSVFLNLPYSREKGRCRMPDEQLITRIAGLTKLTEKEVREIKKKY